VGLNDRFIANFPEIEFYGSERFSKIGWYLMEAISILFFHRFFMTLLEVTRKKLSANNYKRYRKLIHSTVKEVVINRFHLKLQLPATCQDSGEFIFQKDCHSTED